MMMVSPIGTRTTAVAGNGATACSCTSVDSRPFGACSMSMSRKSMPDSAQISASVGEPVHSHMPASVRSDAARASRKVGFR